MDKQSQTGFTLIELVMVIILVGIVSVFAVSRFADKAPFSAQAAQNEIIGALRAAQQTAMSRHFNDTITFTITFNALENKYQYDVTVDDGVVTSIFGGPRLLEDITPDLVTLTFTKRGDLTPTAAATITFVGTTLQVCVAESGYARGC